MFWLLYYINWNVSTVLQVSWFSSNLCYNKLMHSCNILCVLLYVFIKLNRSHQTSKHKTFLHHLVGEDDRRSNAKWENQWKTKLGRHTDGALGWIDTSWLFHISTFPNAVKKRNQPNHNRDPLQCDRASGQLFLLRNSCLLTGEILPVSRYPQGAFEGQAAVSFIHV